MVVMAGGRLRGRGFDSRFGIFFFTPFFFLSPFFFLHARSAISMLKHFSSLILWIYYCNHNYLEITAMPPGQDLRWHWFSIFMFWGDLPVYQVSAIRRTNTVQHAYRVHF